MGKPLSADETFDRSRAKLVIHMARLRGVALRAEGGTVTGSPAGALNRDENRDLNEYVVRFGDKLLLLLEGN